MKRIKTSALFLTSAMHHPKTLIGQELLHQTIVNYKKFFSNKNYQSITFWHNNLNFNGLCTVILCFKLTLSITILKITNICRWNRYHFLRFTDIGSAIKDAGFGIKRYLLKSKTSCFGMEETTSKHWRNATLHSKTSCFTITKE